MSARISEHIRKNAYGILAVFIALTGTAYAVDGPNPGQNTIGSEDIIGNEVKSDDIGNGRIFNLDIADDVIQSGKIKDGTLAASDLSSGLTSSLKDSCPANMTKIANTLCVSYTAGGPSHWSTAVVSCANANLRLPSLDELYLIYTKGLLAPAGFYWTSTVDGPLNGNVSQALVVAGSDGSGVFRATSSSGSPYHACVTTPSDG